MARSSFFWRIKWLLVLLFMMVLDFSPIPFSAAVCLYIYLTRPIWFKNFIDRLYSER